MNYRLPTMNFLNFLLDIIYPRRCVTCGRIGNFICGRCSSKIDFFSDQVCPYCERPSPYGFTHPRCQKPEGLDGMFTLAHYRGPIRNALRMAKYQGVHGLFQELGNLLAAKYHNNFPFDYFVPVPLAPKRQQSRGFNQAEKIAEEIARQTLTYRLQPKEQAIGSRQWTVVKLLSRTRETRPQFDLKYDQRKTNVRDAFAINPSFASTMNPELSSTPNRKSVSTLNSGHVPTNSYQLMSTHSFCLVDDVATTGATIFECAKVLKKAGAKQVWAICVARGG